MAIINKTQGVSVLSLQSVAASTVLISSVVDVSNKFAAALFIHFGRRSATAAGAGVNIRVEASGKSSGDGFWWPVAIFTTAFAACTTRAVTTSSASGQNVVSTSTTTGLAIGDIIYIDNTTIGNSEFHRIKLVTASTSVTLEDNLNNTQGVTSNIYNAAEMYTCQLDLASIGRLRLVIDGANFTQAFAIEAFMVTGDNIG